MMNGLSPDVPAVSRGAGTGGNGPDTIVQNGAVQVSHDRYAYLDISYLLQKVEQYEGIAIFARNVRQNLDEAFGRRLAFAVHFLFPDEGDRQRIWTEIWPAAMPLAEDVAFVGHQFKLSGGNIKNIALAPAFLPASDGGVVTMTHIRHATQREYQKLGKVLSATELGGNARSEGPAPRGMTNALEQMGEPAR